jgi:tryptophanyl-tRNA synthetase
MSSTTLIDRSADRPVTAGGRDTDESGSFRRARLISDQLEADLREHPGAHRVLTGDRPTGQLHLGHYIGTLVNRVRLQNLGVPTFIVIPDYQVITDRDAIGPLRERVRELVADYLAIGLDPDRTVIFPHSAIPALNQLLVPFLSLVSVAELERNPTVKVEAADSGRPTSGLLLTYPVHQAADILCCAGTVVPVGRDQLPHLELTRLIARRFNDRYGPVFTEPAALLSAAPTVLGTDGRKMSKSRGNSIALGATEDQTAATIRAARTDGERRISFEPERRPEVANLLIIAAEFTGEPPESIAERVGERGAAALKDTVTAAVNDALRPVRTRRRELMADPGYLDAVLLDGIATVTGIATQTLDRVRAAMGMHYLRGSG